MIVDGEILHDAIPWRNRKYPSVTASIENISEKVLPKKGRAKGKAAIITDESYKENLMAEKFVTL